MPLGWCVARADASEAFAALMLPMSGGQQQRVAIARALVNRPKILFADEPTGNLDSKTSEEVLQMFQELNAKEGLTIVLVTHSPEVGAFAKEAYHIKDGLMVDGTY